MFGRSNLGVSRLARGIWCFHRVYSKICIVGFCNCVAPPLSLNIGLHWAVLTMQVWYAAVCFKLTSLNLSPNPQALSCFFVVLFGPTLLRHLVSWGPRVLGLPRAAPCRSLWLKNFHSTQYPNYQGILVTPTPKIRTLQPITII